MVMVDCSGDDDDSIVVVSYLCEAGGAIAGSVEDARRAHAGSCQHNGQAALQMCEGLRAVLTGQWVNRLVVCRSGLES